LWDCCCCICFFVLFCFCLCGKLAFHHQERARLEYLWKSLLLLLPGVLAEQLWMEMCLENSKEFEIRGGRGGRQLRWAPASLVSDPSLDNRTGNGAILITFWKKVPHSPVDCEKIRTSVQPGPKMRFTLRVFRDSCLQQLRLLEVLHFLDLWL
jgi:hypothetical protein